MGTPTGVLGICACLMLLPLCVAGATEDSLARRHVPDDGRIAITDLGYREWAPELVHYTVDTKRFIPGKLVLLDAADKAVPFQIDGDTLAFVASVPKGGTGVYRVTPSPQDRSGENTTLTSGKDGDAFVVRNEFLALRMPAPGSRTYPEPAAAADVSPPILQWAHGERGWMGGARFATKRRIASHAFSVVRQGPACVEYEARYRFAPKGEYVWRVRLSPHMPIAIVTEEFDVGEVTEGQDLLMLDLHRGWTPSRIGWVSGAGENLMAKFNPADYAGHVASKRKAAAEEAPVGGVGAAPKPFRPWPGMVLLSRTAPAGKWGGYVGGIAVWDGEPGTGRTLGLMPLHAGSWRRAMVLNTWHRQSVGVTVGLPLSVRPIRWSLDIADDFSPFSTHEHDEGLSRTYGRRCWGLFVGSRMAEAQARYGYIGLDRYKDWTLDWPDTARAEAYPGGFFSPAHVERLRKTLDQHPDRDYLRNSWYLFSGDVQHAVAHAEKVIASLRKPYGENNLFLVGLSNYRKSQFYAFANLAEDALACPDLPEALRAELRRRLALYAYTMSDPDLNPRGSGVHLGNNNMTINRTLALTYFAGLLPDHPRTPYWLDRAGAYARFKFATQTAPCGTWVACPSYQLYSPTRTLNITQNILRNRGVEDFSKLGYHGSTLRYLGNLTVVDPRFDGLRIIPGMGNSTNLVENVWGFAMAAVAERDPKLAGWLRFINRLANRNQSLEPGPNSHDKDVPHPLYYLPDIPENRAPLQTAFFPAYGVVFRSHFGSPDETTLLFRAGMNWSHWDTDALNVVLYGRGAPLSPGTGYQYYSGPMAEGNAVYHNRVKVGRRDVQEVFGRVDAAVADYGFGPSADYAVADRYYPPELFRDGKGDMHWRRHVLFLKGDRPDSPTAFVLRDTFPGGEARRKWWTWMNLGQADRIDVDGTAFEAVPVNQVAAEANMPARRGQAIRMRTDFGAASWFWLAEPRDVRIRMVAEYGRHDGKGRNETKTLVEVPAGPKQDFFHAVAPVRDGEAPPTCKTLADGVMAVTTPESTDTVFIGDAPFDWDRDGIVFTGKAGAVRVYRDRVALCLNAGSGRVGYRGHVIEGHGPFERVVPLAELKPGVHAVGGTEKKRLSVDLGKGVTVTGEGPFEARLDGDTIRIRTQGRARVLHVTQPPFIVRPQYEVDGQEWMACWTDYPASGWGTYQNTWLIGLSVPGGEHELAVRDMQFPRGWARPFTPLIKGAVVGEAGP